jgi:hypothetical protein
VIVRRWLHFWFEPAEPFSLGVCRAFFFAGVLLMYAGEDFGAWGTVPDAFWMPLPLFSALHLAPLSAASLDVAQTVWRSALVLSAAGLFTRWSMATAALLGVYLLGLPHNFGHTFHFDAALAITGIVLACSRAGDAWSLDAALGRTPRVSAPSGEYTWPIRMVWVTTALVFFAAGVAKLRYGGIEWVASENMRILLLRAAYHVSDGDPITRAGLWIAGHAWLSRSLAAAALITECGFALSLVSVRARAVFVPAAFAMLLGIRVLMGPTFGGFLIVNVFWVPWEKVAQRVRASRAARIPLGMTADEYDISAEDAQRGTGRTDVLV